ncbi:MAG: MFS transporter [Chloroflexota bacterium]
MDGKTPRRGWTPPWAGLPRNVVVLGVVSFFADLSTEMVYPLIPLFLTGVLGAPVAVVGLIEGIAESTASLLKVASGWWSDRVGRRLPLAVAGYGLAAVGKLLLAVAWAWPVVLLARFVDRTGKGLRGSPRDALIADSTEAGSRGRAFGFHRAMDTAGAAIGPLIGLALVAALDGQLRPVFALAVIPGLLSVAALAMVREPAAAARTAPAAPLRLSLSLEGFDPRLRRFLLAAAAFALGNSSDVFLILRARELGLTATAAVLAYVLFNLTYMAAALPAGSLSDRIGQTRVYVAGLLVFALVYLGFAAAREGWQIWPLFAAYGLYMALTEGVGKALIADLAPRDRRATAIGVYGALTGIGLLVSSTAAGLLWDRVGPGAPFVAGAVAALVCAAMLAFPLGDEA